MDQKDINDQENFICRIHICLLMCSILEKYIVLYIIQLKAHIIDIKNVSSSTSKKKLCDCGTL